MLKKFPLLKKSHDCFSNRIKTARFVVPLIVLGELKVFNGPQMHSKKILRHTWCLDKVRTQPAITC